MKEEAKIQLFAVFLQWKSEDNKSDSCFYLSDDDDDDDDVDGMAWRQQVAFADGNAARRQRR